MSKRSRAEEAASQASAATSPHDGLNRSYYDFLNEEYDEFNDRKANKQVLKQYLSTITPGREKKLPDSRHVGNDEYLDTVKKYYKEYYTKKYRERQNERHTPVLGRKLRALSPITPPTPPTPKLWSDVPEHVARAKRLKREEDAETESDHEPEAKGANAASDHFGLGSEEETLMPTRRMRNLRF